MEKTCPFCNNLEIKICNCEKCGAIIEDKGIIQELFDDYIANIEVNDNNEYFVHIYQCSSKCKFFSKINVKKILI